MSSYIYLVRHAETVSNVMGVYTGWLPEDISRTGKGQARRVASRLKDFSIKAVYSSPLKRTLTTAEIIASPHSLTPQIVDGLTEIQLGDWQGKSGTEVRERWPELWEQSRRDPSQVTFPNGESFAQMADRAIKAFEEIAAQNRDEDVVIVSHNIVIKALIAYILEAPGSIYRRFAIDNASVTTVRIMEHGRRLLHINDVCHLRRE